MADQCRSDRCARRDHVTHGIRRRCQHHLRLNAVSQFSVEKRHPQLYTNRSLDRLRLDYVDLYLIHWPVPGCYPETWRALEKIRESGRAKSIGVSNFEEPHLTALFEFSGIIPAVNQIECHPLWNRKPLIAFCRSHGIAVQAYAPLARGLYLNREIMQQLAEKYVRTEAQIGLRYLVQQGISVIPKSTQPDRIFANADVFDFELSEADMALIDTMDEQLRSVSIPDDLL